MEAAGLTVSRDAVGNVIGRSASRRRRSPSAPIIDTVPDAGRFDGPLGVLARARRRRADGRRAETTRPLEVAAFADEEGTRFGFPTSARRRYAGGSMPAWLDLVEAPRASRSARRCARRAPTPRAAPAHLGRARRLRRGPYRAGNRARAGGSPVGVVTAIAGQTRAAVIALTRRGGPRGDDCPWAPSRRARGGERGRARGRAARSRRGRAGRDGRAFRCHPTSRNVVPGEARLSVDVRHPDDAMCARASQRRPAGCCRGSRRRGHRAEWTTRQRRLPSRWLRRSACAWRRPSRPRASGSAPSPAARAMMRSSSRASARRRCSSSAAPGDQPRPAGVRLRGRRRGRDRRARAGRRAVHVTSRSRR